MVGSRNWLFASKPIVFGGFAAGSVLLSDEPRHARTRLALLAASILWSIAWVNVWNSGPLSFIASLIGPAPAAIAIWGLLQFPGRGATAAQPGRSCAHCRCTDADARLPADQCRL